MKKMNLIFLLLSCVIFSSAQAQESNLDSLIKDIIIKNDLKPLEEVTDPPVEVTRLGAMLFHETELSGTRQMSCVQCHHPRLGTSDRIPFSKGVLGLTKRHSPHVLNLGYPEIEFMFWDGRVHFDRKTGIFTTPEKAFNGKNPLRADITSVMTSSLSMQTIFPIANALEMKGDSGNDIADTDSDLEAWEAVMTRLTKGPKSDRYNEQLKKAYPNTSKFNIGHIGEALGSFLKRSFNVIDTPYDRYLRGDRSALTPSEKRGLIVFAGRGQCMNCHNGSHLSNFEFKTVGTPQLTPSTFKAPFDEGRFEVTGVKSDLFKFRTPALRNLAITAPYMHNGAFTTLRDVIEHYDDPSKSLNAYDQTMADLSAYASENFVVDRDPKRNKLRISLISIGEVRRGLKLTDSEKEDLLHFLRRGLLDYRFHRQLK